jgi:hypothetical protein
MLKGKERQMVLDYLYQECIKNSKDSFMSRKKMTCKIESQWNYESLSNKERVHIYNAIISQKIITYLKENVINSLAIDFVNGSPEKRKIRIEEWASNKYKTMSKAEKVAICEIIGFKYLNN